MVIIDHTLENEQMREAVQIVRKLDQKVWILLLVAQPRDASTFEDFCPDAVMHDGFSRTDLIEGIRRAKSVHSTG